MTRFRKQLREVLDKDYDPIDLFEAIDEIHDVAINELEKDKQSAIDNWIAEEKRSSMLKEHKDNFVEMYKTRKLQVKALQTKLEEASNLINETDDRNYTMNDIKEDLKQLLKH